jgi:glutathione S-transferase
MLALYGHPFSSYTWKALIALYACDIPFDFRIMDENHPDNVAFVAGTGPLGKFPVLAESGRTVFEATAIIEYLVAHHPAAVSLLPSDPKAAVLTRMLDRVFDNYVMGPMQEEVVAAYIRQPDTPDPDILERSRDQLDRSYAWLDLWLDGYTYGSTISLIECAAAPSLFYSDWVHAIPQEFARLQKFRAHLLGMPPVKRCVEEARPYRAYFPLGAPDRD